MKRFVGIFLVVVMVLSSVLLVVPTMKVGAAAQKGLNTDINSVSGSEFTKFNDLAAKLDSVFAGNVGLYSDSARTKSVLAKLGTRAVAPGKTLYWKCNRTSCSGESCFAYAVSAYCTIYDGTHPHLELNGNHERITAGNGSYISYDNFVKWGVRNDVPVYIRIGTSNTVGHSILVLTYTEDYIIYLDGNGDSNGLIAIRKEPWVNKFDSYTGSNIYARKILYIVQPKDSYYSKHQCVTFEGCGVCTECGKTFDWESTLDKSVAGTYKVAKDFTPRTTMPYDDSAKASTTIAKNTTVEVVGTYTNAFGNKWYKFTYNSGKSVGYVLSTYLTFSSHTHSFGTSYYSDSSSHWKICTSCDSKGTVSSHSYDNTCDTNCNICGYQRSITHTYSNSSDTTCNICGYVSAPANTYDFLFPANIGAVTITRIYDSSASHHGIDIVSTGDQLVYAAFSGTVTRISNSCNHVHYNAKCDHYSSWGNSIYIKSEDGKIYGIYGHLKQDSFLVKVGDTVERGQPIASMGSSGFSSERQAHFEIRTDTSSSKYSINVNPYNSTNNPGVVAYSTTGYKPIVSDAIDEETYTFANDEYKMYMKQDANASGTIGASNASATSKFNFRIIKDGNFYRIIPEDGTNNYLRSAWNDSQNTHSISGAEVILGANDANNYSQKWIFEKYGDGYIIHPACTPAFAITRDGSKLVVKKTDYSAAQIWTLEIAECSHTYQYEHDNTIGSVHWQECTKCGDRKDYSAHELISQKFDDENLSFVHLNYCNVCGIEYAAQHSYNNDCDNSCNDCGYIRQVEHSYGFYCDKSCNICGYTRDAAHQFDGPCDMDCNYGCGYIRQVEHSYSNACDSSCNVCGTIRPITHTYSDDYDATCNVCGSTRDVAHVHSYGDYEYDFYGHWRVCLDCGEADGAAKPHTISGMSEVNDTYHGGECSVCDGKFTYKHTYTDDCDTSCNECENIREVTHFYTDNNDNTCNSCGYERNKECQAHTLGAWTVTVESTCISNGVMTRYCDNCEYFETKEIARDAHNDADGNGACDSCNRTIEEVDNNANDELDVQVSGCGSVIGGSLWFVAVILVSTVAIAADKKRKY